MARGPDWRRTPLGNLLLLIGLEATTPATREALWRVVQQALENVLTHAAATGAKNRRFLLWPIEGSHVWVSGAGSIIEDTAPRLGWVWG